ncbi:MAG: flavodoxin-dependent (E)-4-hydroxy-3-methylbut-2-enyl-diphosphate synthase [Verrucomicrobiota bacterium]
MTPAVRRRTRIFKVGSVPVGGQSPVSIQSMTNAPAADAEALMAQIRSLAAAGCEIVRVAVPSSDTYSVFEEVLADSPLPVIADIHFDWRLAVGAVERGAHGIRINPGNIGGMSNLKRVAHACRAAGGTPIRVGVNAGSLDSSIKEKYGGASPEALSESAQQSCRILEDAGCSAIKVSLKASDVGSTVAACRHFAARTDYPLHLGVTEAGTRSTCTVKSAMGIGALLLDGIGDTLRVSLTGNPVDEIRLARRILQAAGCRRFEPEVVACPTCGRTAIDLIPAVQAVESALDSWLASGLVPNVRKIAVMGCVVNGPGEATDADIGLAGGAGKAALFRDGAVFATIPEEGMVTELLRHLESLLVPAREYAPSLNKV